MYIIYITYIMNLNLQEIKLTRTFGKFNFRDLIIFIIPFIVLVYYLNVYIPGVYTFDSFNQLHQIASGNFNDWQPFFHTFIEMILLKIYPSAITIGIVQIITFSTIWMLICKYNRKDELRTNKYFIMQVIVTLIISLIPVNAIYSITLWKDILFSYALLFLCFLMQLFLDKKGNLSLLFIIVMSLTMAFVAQLRLNGLYIVIPLLIFIAYYLYRNNKKEKLFVLMPALTIMFIILIASLSVAYEVEDTHKDGVFAKVAHMLADYDLNLDLSEADKNKIHEMISEKDIKSKYNPYFTDPIRDTANQDVYDKNKNDYITMAIAYSLKNPIHFLEYMIGSSNMAWDITRDADWKGTVYYINEDGVNLQHAKENFYSKTHSTPKESYEDVVGVNEGTGEYNAVNSYVYAAKSNIILDTLFNSPALYMYLAFILMAGIYFFTRSTNVVWIYLPNLLNILTVAVSTPIQDNRYLYASLLVFYFLVIMLIGILSRDELTLTQVIGRVRNGHPIPYGPSSQEVSEKPLKTTNYVERPAENIYEPVENEYKEYESILEELSVDDINSMLEEPVQQRITQEVQKPQESRKTQEDSSSDLIDDILKEMDIERK